jgi:hypothetical protein
MGEEERRHDRCANAAFRAEHAARENGRARGSERHARHVEPSMDRVATYGRQARRALGLPVPDEHLRQAHEDDADHQEQEEIADKLQDGEGYSLHKHLLRPGRSSVAFGP